MSELASEKEVFVGVVRSSGDAMFHRQDCSYAKRAMSGQWYFAEDFQRGDVWCSRCCHNLRGRPASADEVQR